MNLRVSIISYTFTSKGVVFDTRRRHVFYCSTAIFICEVENIRGTNDFLPLENINQECTMGCDRNIMRELRIYEVQYL